MPLFPTAIDRRFRRFCRTGDPKALGRVFDATAPELLRVGCWLAGNRADAEDLVQRTFVAAIERRTAFAADGHALPWLVGILGNLARQLQRERSRVPPAPREPSADPSDEAARAELTERLATLRAELGAPYADVLQLHLEQGLSAKEIAARLQRPAGTVRTQLMRALALLRERLPTGFVAGGAAALLGPSVSAASPALAAMRRVVLAAAEPPGASALGVPLVVTGSWLVGKKLVAVGSLLLAATFFVVMAPWRDAREPEPPAAGASTLAAGTLAGTARPDTPAPVPSAARTPAVAIAAAAGTASEPGLATLRVHATFGENEPAAGVGVFADNGHAAARRDAVTGPDGFAELRHLAPGAWRVGAVLSEDVTRCTLAADEVHTLELAAARRAIARGRVVDANDQPVAGARIWQSHDGQLAHGHEVAVTGDDGTFAVPLLGGHALSARKTGYLPSYEVIASPLHADGFVLRLDRPAGTLRGVVRDERGTPVARARVLVGEQHHRMVEGSAHPTDTAYTSRGTDVVTADDGTFAVDVAPIGRVPVHAWAVGFAPCDTHTEVAAQGESHVTIVLSPGARAAGTVRDAAGKPVAGAEVSWSQDHEFAFATAITDGDGNFVLADLPAGRESLRAELRGVRVEQALSLQRGKQTSWDPVLALGRAVRGRVVAANDRSLAGLVVTAWRGSHRVAERDVAPDGSFALEEVGDGVLSLEVWHDGQTLLTRADVPTPGVDVVLALTEEHLPTATLVGRLVDERGRPVDATVVPRRDGVMRGQHGRTDNRTGVFRITNLRPGRYRIDVASELGAQTLGDVELAPRTEVDVGERVLRTPGALELKVTALGRPVASGFVLLTRPDGDWAGDGVVEQGMVRHTSVAPGVLHAYVSSGDLGQWTELTIVAGTTTRAALDLQPTHCATVTLHDPLGRPIEELGARLVARRPDGTFAGVFAPARSPGGSVFVQLPPGTYRLHATTRDGRTAELDVDLRAGDVARTCELPRE